jgi:hypothetical protein
MATPKNGFDQEAMARMMFAGKGPFVNMRLQIEE